MADKITEEDRTKAQQLIREVVLIFSGIGELEEKIRCIRKQNTELYERLDSIADGKNPG